MPLATLLLREETASSLSTLVEKSQHRKPPLPSYDLHLTPTHLDLTPLPPETPDEGFESDIDSLSIVSSDGSETKTTETDSANGSASSDSDTETPELTRSRTESHNLVDCVCYTDVKFPDVLIFVIKNSTLVFKFDNLVTLKNFYLNFTAVKAVTNQKAYNKNGAKFNLLQRTDNNGVTHIEITREPELSKILNTPTTPSSIISLNTPEVLVTPPLRKVWSSADDLLSPKRPERRKKVKGRAPPPPPTPDILRGEYVRVNVNTTKDKDFIAKSQLKEKKPVKPNLVALFKPVKTEPVWSNSLKKQRSKSETRCFTPMAYRYIDTAPTYSPMGNRLFGLSSKLRDFGEVRECRWNSVAELNYKEGNLKSVIKKEESKKKNEKKVTFSAYTTVQVV
ncbi:uncharacterized protein LOC123008499 [Tribolium madens]|uniref:uncharacterized protein LOC123008499 n=1 Tax=Tribolium madens TaxID=41895 RepID=UPI001CF755ED|nr:uncharacterized protein LOC123008499 [Tribolium madens]